MPVFRWSWQGIVALLWIGLGALPGSAQTPTAPTDKLDPAEIDQVWQKANAKYDPARNAILEQVEKADHDGPFRPQWESLDHYEVPEWYEDAKFGIFIHWGVYSVPAFGNEWYPRNMYTAGSDENKHHVATYGPPDKFGYKDFIPRFKPNILILPRGRSCLRTQAQSMWCPCSSITTVSPCMIAAFRTGQRRRWGRIAIWWAIWRRPSGRKDCISALPRTA